MGQDCSASVNSTGSWILYLREAMKCADVAKVMKEQGMDPDSDDQG